MQADIIIQDISESTEVPAAEKVLLCLRLSSLLVFSHILLLPFLFGGVHESVQISFRVLTLFVLMYVFVADYKNLKACFSGSSGKVLTLLSVCFCFMVAHTLVYQFLISAGVQHPLLEHAGALMRVQVSVSQLADFFHLIALFVLCRYYIGLHDIQRKLDGLVSAIIVSGSLAAMTGLMHWFYDNGKLFWTFSAYHEASSNRARWPFVNPNHLAIFLTVPYFLIIGRIQEALERLRKKAKSSLHRGNLMLADFISKKESQLILRSLLLYSSSLLIVLLAIIASLSRNAGVTTFIMTLIYFLRPRFRSVVKPVTSVSTEEEYFDHSRQRRVKKVRRTSSLKSQKLNSFNIESAVPVIRNIFRFAVVAGLIWLVMFFLGERGGDLFKARIEYAMLYTQDDMRWQMYSDSWPMLSDYFYMGIGLANWSALYPSYMSTGLSGMNPAYLHSDILQLLIELGLPGLVAFVCLILGWSKQLLAKRRYGGNYLIFPLLFGFLSLVLCGSFEFPFRIPAISSLALIVMAIGASLPEDDKNHIF